jgi:hypothetical protein
LLCSVLIAESSLPTAWCSSGRAIGRLALGDHLAVIGLPYDWYAALWDGAQRAVCDRVLYCSYNDASTLLCRFGNDAAPSPLPVPRSAIFAVSGRFCRYGRGGTYVAVCTPPACDRVHDGPHGLRLGRWVAMVDHVHGLQAAPCASTLCLHLVGFAGPPLILAVHG